MFQEKNMNDQTGGPIIMPDANDRDMATIAWASNQDAKVFIAFHMLIAPTGDGTHHAQRSWHRETGDEMVSADIDAPIGECDFLRLESGRVGERADLVTWCTLGGEVDDSDPNAGVLLPVCRIGGLSGPLADVIIATLHTPIPRERVEAFLAECAGAHGGARA
jgi:hypothetical protein